MSEHRTFTTRELGFAVEPCSYRLSKTGKRTTSHGVELFFFVPRANRQRPNSTMAYFYLPLEQARTLQEALGKEIHKAEGRDGGHP